jgi:hypothetical protein
MDWTCPAYQVELATVNQTSSWDSQASTQSARRNSRGLLTHRKWCIANVRGSIVPDAKSGSSSSLEVDES